MLWELALLFLRLGATAFGGPAAHIAMMEDEVVRRRGWLTRDEFLDLLGATNLIPGPNSTELAIHIGLRRAGLDATRIRTLVTAFRILFRTRQNLREAMAQVEASLQSPDVDEVLAFIRASRRGVAMGPRAGGGADGDD